MITRMPSRAQLVLLEIAAAAVAVALALRELWLPIGIAVAVVFAALAIIPVRRRWLYQVLASWWSMLMRSMERRGHGIASLAGNEYEVITVPPGSRGVTMGALRDTSTWSVPLELPLVDLFNEDRPIPLQGLASLLHVEEIELSSVRLITLMSPATMAQGAPNGPVTPYGRLATRYLVLTLDAMHSADVIAERGGDQAVHQILRRCVLRAEEVLSAAGVQVRRMSQRAVTTHSETCLGPLTPGPDGQIPAAAESFAQVELAGSASVTLGVTGEDAILKLNTVTAHLPVPIAATSVLLQAGPHGPTMTLLLRLSGPSADVRRAEAQVDAAARQLSLTLHRFPGQQVPMLKATTLLGVPAAAA